MTAAAGSPAAGQAGEIDEDRHRVAPAVAVDVSVPDVSPARTDPGAHSGRAVEPAGPSSTIDRLRELWSAVLGAQDIGPDADFFDLGGNSLTAVELMSNVRAEFRVEVGVVILFDHSTLDALAYQIDRRIG